MISHLTKMRMVMWRAPVFALSLSVALAFQAPPVILQSFSNPNLNLPAFRSISHSRTILKAADESPPSIPIPEHKLDISFVRSSGAGGQNVNKVNTKVQIKLGLYQANWIPEEVKSRLFQQQKTRINNRGELIVTCQDHRTQLRNKADALSKLQAMVDQAAIEPKERSMYEGISEKGKKKRVEFKRKRSLVKQNRKRPSADY
mmetsp:Transcript_14316/g.21056  ORF Transcript_14316/g.21056 Transcript_14316/m.21056 type:complete len:202 (-) Transcript_14316:77-682(-)